MQFNAVMEEGKIVHSLLFMLRVLHSDTLKDTRVSAVVPLKIAKQAVMRNRLRRQVYEAIKPVFTRIASHTHTIVFVKSGVMTVDFGSISKGLREIFVKAGLLK